MPRISFTVPAPVRLQINAILTDAVVRKVIKPRDRLDIEMSLSAYIAQGGKPDLDKLAAFDDFDLAHDLYGINRHIDQDETRDTAGQLLDCFLPRCARGEADHAPR